MGTQRVGALIPSGTILDELFVRQDAAQVPTDGGTWPDYASNPKIARIKDRVFIGKGADFSGTWDGTDNSYLLTARWIPRESTVYGTSSEGRIGISGVSRANLSPNAPAGALPNVMPSIGVVGFCYQDKLTSDATRSVYGWGGYFEAVQKAGAQAAFGVEIDIGNLGADSVARTPYNVFGIAGSWGLIVASGGSMGGPYSAATLGIGIVSNGGKYKTGLLFDANAILGTDGVTGTGVAIDLAKGHLIEWMTPESPSLQGAYIFSSVAANANKMGQEFTDDVVKFLRNNTVIAKVEHGAGASASANFLRLLSGAAGSPTILIAGSDTNANVDLNVRPKGTGTGSLNGGSAGLSRFGWNDTGIGFFGATLIAKQTGTPAAATDLASVISLANDLRTKLINYGLVA